VTDAMLYRQWKRTAPTRLANRKITVPKVCLLGNYMSA
jgi:hypothetical protein